MRKHLQSIVAEGVGFEPTEDPEPSTVFKTAAFNRSATPPAKAYLNDLRMLIIPHELVEINESLVSQNHKNISKY